MQAAAVLAVLALTFASSVSLATGSRLASMRSVVVLDDPLAYDIAHVKNGDRLRSWLADNGATALNTDDLVAWIEDRIATDDAYGTALALTYGILPAELVDSPTDEPAWFRYLARGGRIVNVGGAPLHEIVTVTGRPRTSPLTRSTRRWVDVRAGWDTPYWGVAAKTRSTPRGREWGIENPGSSIVGVAATGVAAFHVYTARDGSTGASNWFKNLSPERPWGGLVHVTQTYDGADDSVLRDTWRAIHYVGTPVEIPAVPPPLSEAPGSLPVVMIEASGQRGRSAIAVGETVRFVVDDPAAGGRTRARLDLIDPQGDAIDLAAPREGAVVWDSSGYAPGEYTLVAAVKRRKASDQTIRRAFTLARPLRSEFPFQMWVDLTENPLRNRRILDRVRSAGMDTYLAKPDLDSMDEVMAAGLSFSGRVLPVLRTPETSDESALRIDIDGTPARYKSGKLKPSLTSAAVIGPALERFATSFGRWSGHPAFMGVVLTNDDYSLRYGWDFAGAVAKRFETLTGRRPPRERPDPPDPGIVEDDDLWLAWNAFSLDEVSGGFNRKQRDALEAVRPGTWVGPIPGPMNRPLIQMKEAAQYPPLNFGKHGFPLVSFYYYNGFWAPLLTNTYWTEIARMGNRDLPVWVMPDCYQGGAVYVRNNAYHLLAGGVRGLAYFRDVECREPQWQELERLGQVISRIAPIQAALEPVARRVALLVSFTTSCFEHDHAVRVAYAYHRLMQAGYIVDVIAEEEVLAGASADYEAIVLHDVGWLRRSVVETLTAYSRTRGKVLLDATVPFEIEGATRLRLELGSGVPAEPASKFKRGSGHPTNYGNAERIARVRRLMTEHIEPDFGGAAGRVVASGFQVRGTPYVWAIDTMDAEAYRFGYERAARRGDRDPLEAMRELWAWDESALAEDDLVVEIEAAPAAGAVYDVANGRQVPVTRTETGSTFTLHLPRFGGALLAFVEEPVIRLDLEAPEIARRGQTIEFHVRLRGGDGQTGLRTLDVALPVEFELVAPDGRAYDGNRSVGTVAGEATFTWKPAINDLKGNWTLTVRQSASGHSARVTLPLW